ncbi:hepatocyte growth factor receptor-like [Mercenaria mercenaria]|uniref:hepatocyte growth factor receptor-like n=1 Tax=Mercenaria mercenaria TaxID=6596 RepID=UPI00234E43C0|nr:hepatocyte growth factor receptor-like [Mercenaria mercenaria]
MKHEYFSGNNPKDLDVNMFLKEALLMKDFHHNNVMELIGICLGVDKLPLVVLPFMRKGDVLSYIRDVNNQPTVKELVVFGVDIANGMHYLSQLKFIHRDLAARNCMIDDNMRVKVADFGLSRDVYEKEYYSSCDKKAQLPVKWMSPESLEFGLFTHKSDVWSFGVVLWELLTRGVNPYPTVDNWDILRYLKAGRRLYKPDFCPDEMYRIMQQCWNWNPDERPLFGDLTIKIPELLRNLERASEKRKQLETSY